MSASANTATVTEEAKVSQLQQQTSSAGYSYLHGLQWMTDCLKEPSLRHTLDYNCPSNAFYSSYGYPQTSNYSDNAYPYLSSSAFLDQNQAAANTTPEADCNTTAQQILNRYNPITFVSGEDTEPSITACSTGGKPADYRNTQLSATTGHSAAGGGTYPVCWLHQRTDAHTKPPFSYITLIVSAMNSKPSKQITLSEIYSWITENFAYYRKNTRRWQNSIRHALSFNDCFIKVPRPSGEAGKGSYWTVHPNALDMFESGSSMRRNRKFVDEQRHRNASSTSAASSGKSHVVATKGSHHSVQHQPHRAATALTSAEEGPSASHSFESANISPSASSNSRTSSHEACPLELSSASDRRSSEPLSHISNLVDYASESLCPSLNRFAYQPSMPDGSLTAADAYRPIDPAPVCDQKSPGGNFNDYNNGGVQYEHKCLSRYYSLINQLHNQSYLQQQPPGPPEQPLSVLENSSPAQLSENMLSSSMSLNPYWQPSLFDSPGLLTEENTSDSNERKFV